VVPEVLVDLYEAHQDGNRSRVLNLLRTVIRSFVDTTRPLPSSPALKYLLSKRGHNVGDPLPPFRPLTDAQRERLDACYREHVESRSVSE